MHRETNNTCSLKTLRSHFQSLSTYQIDQKTTKQFKWAHELSWLNKIYTGGDIVIAVLFAAVNL